MKRLLLILFLLLPLVGCGGIANCQLSGGSAAPVRVLFLGNSYTYVNDLPGTFARLACSGGHRVSVDSVAEGGWRLADHVASANSMAKLTGQKWDFVVLQEQSEIPAVPAWRGSIMYPAARTLAAKVKENGAQLVFFLTWGHKDGLSDARLANYAQMQAGLNQGYADIATELRASTAPVGKAWQAAVTGANPINLWQDDGSHPNPSGTYLAACVFYGQIFNEDPTGLPYTDGLSADTAQTLQTLAKNSIISR